jgi:hypothetical protein
MAAPAIELPAWDGDLASGTATGEATRVDAAAGPLIGVVAGATLGVRSGPAALGPAAEGEFPGGIGPGPFANGPESDATLRSGAFAPSWFAAEGGEAGFTGAAELFDEAGESFPEVPEPVDMGA